MGIEIIPAGPNIVVETNTNLMYFSTALDAVDERLVFDFIVFLFNKIAFSEVTKTVRMRKVEPIWVSRKIREKLNQR